MHRGSLISGALAILVLLAPPIARAATPQEDLQQLDREVVAGQHALGQGDVATARQAYQDFEDGWPGVEDAVRGVDRDGYRAIEAAMRDARRTLLSDPVDPAAAATALGSLHDQDVQFGGADQTQTASEPPSVSTGSDADQLRALVSLLDTARADVARHDEPAAIGAVKNFEAAWPGI